jgi:sarcosine oxidase, subunit gamma
MPEVATRSVSSVRTTPWMRALPPATRLILQGGAAGRAAAAPIWGVALAEQACRAIAQGGRATLWLGPDEYLLLGPPDERTGRAAGELERALSGIPHALVDISHRQLAIEISGPHAAIILSGACPLDLHLSEFPVGMCTRTVLAKADIVLWRTGSDAFHLEIWRSFCDYVTGLLTEIAAEHEGG